MAKKPVEQQNAVVEKEPAPVIKEAPAVKAAPIKKTAASKMKKMAMTILQKMLSRKISQQDTTYRKTRMKKSPYFKKWRVRKEGSTKTIKYFDTQKRGY